MKAVVYGGGFSGKVLVHYLYLYSDFEVEALVVSDGHRELDEYALSEVLVDKKVIIPVIELSNLEQSKRVVFNTVVSGKEKVESDLVSTGIVNIGDIKYPENEYPEYINTVFKSYLYKTMRRENEIITFGDVKLDSIVYDDSQYYSTFLVTFGDVILPGIFGDYTFAVDGPYELDECRIKPGDVVIDAGANLGLFTCYAAQKGCKVFACDPDKRCISILLKQKNLYPDIIVVPKGLSNRVGTAEFYESQECAISSMVMARGKTEKTVIELCTIDYMVETGLVERVDYIKSDIEGAERDLLRGAINTLREYGPKLSICTYHFPGDPQLLETIIKEANPKYVVKHAWRKLYAYIPKCEE